MSVKQWRGDISLAQVWNFNLIPTRLKPLIIVKWQKPNEGWIKLNTDATVKLHTSMGGIIRDSDGRFIYAFQNTCGKITLKLNFTRC